MTDTSTTRPATPVWFWIISGLALVWTLAQLADVILTVTAHPGYQAGLSPEQLAHLAGYPLWFEALWALGVLAGVAGSLGFLLRRALALPLFIIALIAFLATSSYDLAVADAAAVMGDGMIAPLIGMGVIFSVLVVIARWGKASGVLR